MSNILRDMRKGKQANASKKLNTSSYIDSGRIMSHVAQGILRNSRKIRKDHVIWQPDNDREENRKAGHPPTMSIGGQFSAYGE